MRTNVTPPMIKALLPRAPLAASTIVQKQFTPRFIRSLLFRPPLTGGAILGNGSVIEIEADCWSKAQSDSCYPLVATFNSLGSTVTSIDGRVSTLETDVGASDGRVTALENSGGVAPTADLTVNSLTATTFVDASTRRKRDGKPTKLGEQCQRTLLLLRVPTTSPVAPPGVPATAIFSSGATSSFGGRAESYLPELRQCLFVPNEIQQVSLPSDTAGRSAQLFYLLQQALAKWDRGLEILRSVSTRQGNAAAGYKGVRAVPPIFG